MLVSKVCMSNTPSNNINVLVKHIRLNDFPHDTRFNDVTKVRNLLTCEVGVLSATKECCKRIPRYKATKQSIAARKQKSKSVGKAEEPSEARTN